MGRYWRVMISLAFLCPGSAELAFAQAGLTSAQADSAEAAIECFPLTFADRVEDCREGYYSAQGILSSPGEFSDQLVESVLDGLEKFAIETEDSYLRTQAISWISGAGMPSYPGGPRPGIVARLDRIYPAAEAYANRMIMVIRLGYQNERAAAARSLERIAREPPDPQYSKPIPALAVSSLRQLGAEGEARLEALRRSGIVKERSEVPTP